MKVLTTSIHSLVISSLAHPGLITSELVSHANCPRDACNFEREKVSDGKE